MRDLKSDWKRWSPVERMSVLALAAIVVMVVCGSIVGGVAGEAAVANFDALPRTAPRSAP